MNPDGSEQSDYVYDYYHFEKMHPPDANEDDCDSSVHSEDSNGMYFMFKRLIFS